MNRIVEKEATIKQTAEEKIKKEFLVGLVKRIKQLRIERNLTQADLAILCKTDVKMVSRVERGLYNIKITSLLKLFNAFKISLEELFDFEEFKKLSQY